MAKVTKRVWTSRGPTGRRVNHVAYGYTVVVGGRSGSTTARGAGMTPRGRSLPAILG
jgi:hypothetical protein